MKTLFRNALQVVTCDDDRRRIDGGDVLVEDRRIVAVGPGLDRAADRIVDCAGCLIIPGMVNVHHHLYQTLTRNVAGAQNSGLFDWLRFHYPVWAGLTPEAVRAGALVGIAELLLTGCTATSDHFYVFPRGQPGELLDETIRAAAELGIRFAPTRGSMSLGESAGGLPPDVIVQDEDTILADCVRVLDTWHDPSADSMCRVGLAPCSPFSVSEDLLRETARLATDRSVGCHTHLAETLDEERYCLDRYGIRPVELMDRIGWMAPNVWYAHCVHLDRKEVQKFADRGVGVAHCPTSNMRLGSGLASVPELVAAGVRVGLGVDGSASNDSSDMVGEVRNCLLANRSRGGPAAMDAGRALELATRGGASILGFDSGVLAPGRLADLAIFDLSGLGYAGADHDPLAALVFCGFEHRARHVMVNGVMVVEEGRLMRVDESEIARTGRRASRGLLERAGLA